MDSGHRARYNRVGDRLQVVNEQWSEASRPHMQEMGLEKEQPVTLAVPSRPYIPGTYTGTAQRISLACAQAVSHAHARRKSKPSGFMGLPHHVPNWIFPGLHSKRSASTTQGCAACRIYLLSERDVGGLILS